MKKITIDSSQKNLKGSIINDDMKYSRKMIDSIDARILQLLERRMKYAGKIGKIKKEKGMKIFDKKREEEILKNKTKQTSLDKNFVKEIFKTIIKQSRKIQE